jgi:hypothetical protein
VPDTTTLERALGITMPPINMVPMQETGEPKGLQLVTFDDGTYKVQKYEDALYTLSVEMGAASMIDVAGLLVNIADAQRGLN